MVVRKTIDCPVKLLGQRPQVRVVPGPGASRIVEYRYCTLSVHWLGQTGAILIGPGSLHAPPVVLVASVADHC